MGKYFRARLCQGTHSQRDVVAVADHDDPIALVMIMREAARHWKATATVDQIATAMLKRQSHYEFGSGRMFLEFDYPEQIIVKIE